MDWLTAKFIVHSIFKHSYKDMLETLFGSCFCSADTFREQNGSRSPGTIEHFIHAYLVLFADLEF